INREFICSTSSFSFRLQSACCWCWYACSGLRESNELLSGEGPTASYPRNRGGIRRLNDSEPSNRGSSAALRILATPILLSCFRDPGSQDPHSDCRYPVVA